MEFNYRQYVDALWYICHIDNLELILRHGILSHNDVTIRGIPHVDVADPRVQINRTMYHGFVPLFFADNTPMLYRLIRDHGVPIILLEIDPSVILLPNVNFADGNIAAHDTRRYFNLTDLDKLDMKIIRSRSKTLSKEWRRKRAAEVLVPQMVESSRILKIYVQSQHIESLAQGALQRVGANKPITVSLSEKGIYSN